MAVGRSEETALGSARGRFLESLPRKAIELRGTIATLTATPAAEGPRADMRRKLHALYASALVFRSDALAALVQEGIAFLDAASEAKRPLSTTDLESLSGLVKRLTELRSEERFSAPPARPSITAPSEPPLSFKSESSRPATVPPASVPPASAAPASERPASAAPSSAFTSTPTPAKVPVASRPPGARSNTLTGLLPVGVPVPTPAQMPGRWVARGSSRPPAPTLSRMEPAPILQRVLHVLLVAREEAIGGLASLLHHDGFRVSAVSSARTALDSARDDAPDVVLAEADLAFRGKLLDALRDDPLTDFVPLVVVAGDDPLASQQARQQGADEVVTRPLHSDQLKRVLGRVTGTLVQASTLVPAPQEATLDEVCTRVSQEIRRGLIEAAESGRELRVPVGDSAEIMAAAWAAVARVRAVFAERSGGRVRFHDRPMAGAPALLAMGSTTDDLATLAGESPLAGRRIVVADDDTAVVLFFAGLLRDEGAYVTEVSDGSEALRAARSERPDLVISDVVMPGLDGFALCRELKRDPLLCDVPVILISWKEDLLVRMRELSSGATGYLRKEASAAQILASVREALRLRGQLEARLARDGEVRGNLEGTGVVALLRSVRRARPDARITLRDGWNLFECELRDGRLVQLTRTASDGSFVRNEVALPQLLGISAGRYSVTSAEGALKQALDGTLDEVLARGARELGAQLDVLTGEALLKVERIVLDEDAQAALLDHATGQVRAVIERLASGVPPRQLWGEALLEQALLEPMLLDMAKRGAVRAVLGEEGEDLVARARVQRAQQPSPELAGPLSLLPPAPDPVISVLPIENSERPQAVDPLGGVASLPGNVLEVESLLPPAPQANEVLGDEPNALPEPNREAVAAPVVQTTEQPPSSQPPPARAAVVASEIRELDRAAAEARSSRGTLWAWTAAFVALLAIGFLADRARQGTQQPTRVEAIGAAPEAVSTPIQNPSAAPTEPAVEPAPEPVPAPLAAPAVAPASAHEGGFEIYDRIVDSDTKVAPNQALLVVESATANVDAVLSIDGKALGGLPAKTPLSEGIHELAITRGDTVTYRFLAPRRGSTWVLRGP